MFTAAAATIDEDGTSAVTIAIANLAELTEDGTVTLTVKISGLPNLSQNGQALTAIVDGSYADGAFGGRPRRPDHHAGEPVRGSIPFKVAVTAP